MCEEPVQDPKAALKQLQPVVEAKQAEGAAYLQQLMKLTNTAEKNDELLEQVPACGAVGGGGRGGVGGCWRGWLNRRKQWQRLVMVAVYR